jgi:DNA-binding CsgD family transcriptional regulator
LHKSQQNRTKHRSNSAWWTPKRLEAVQLCADGSLTNAAIAAQLGISRRTLQYWIADGRFQKEVRRLVDAYGERLRHEIIEQALAKFR